MHSLWSVAANVPASKYVNAVTSRGTLARHGVSLLEANGYKTQVCANLLTRGLLSLPAGSNSRISRAGHLGSRKGGSPRQNVALGLFSRALGQHKRTAVLPSLSLAGSLRRPASEVQAESAPVMGAEFTKLCQLLAPSSRDRRGTYGRGPAS